MIKLTAAIQARICTYIRAGGFPHVAAEAAGVPREQFEHWLSLGREPHARRIYRRFVQAIAEAIAHARIKAEIAAFNQDPLTWLRSGPGKETVESPGWSSPTRALVDAHVDRPDYLLSPEFREMLAGLRTALAPFPDALAAVVHSLEARTKFRKETVLTDESEADPASS